MKIWIINHYAVPSTLSGGTRHHAFARELIGRGHDVVVIASSFHYTTRSALRSGTGGASVEDGVPYLWIRTPGYEGNSAAKVMNMAAFAARLASSAEVRRLPRPDVVLGSTPHLFAALGAYTLARRRRAGFVLEVRDLWPDSIVELGGVSPRHPMIRVMDRIERFLYRRADAIVSLLPAAAAHIGAKGGDTGRVTWIPNGIDLSLVPEPLPVRAVAGKPFTVMYAGAHGVANGLDTVLDAAKIVGRTMGPDRVRFVLLGDGPAKRALCDRAAAEGISNIEFRDPVAKDRVHAALAEADGFLMLLRDSPVFRWGVSPNKLFDYMAAGRPVVFGVRAANDPVADARAGISIPPEDPAALAAAVGELAGTALEQREWMGRNGREYVERNHAFTQLSERLEIVLGSVARR